MAEYTVQITQVYRATRKITVTVEAADSFAAIESVASGDTDIPDFDNPNWQTGWELQNEEYHDAKACRGRSA